MENKTVVQNQNVEFQNRNLSVDILRIACVFLVLWGHYFSHGNIDALAMDGGIIRVFLSTFFSSGSRMACDVFVLITGYFSISTRFCAKRIVKIAFIMSFYTFISACVGYGMGFLVISKGGMLKELIKTICPFIGGNWFAVCYLWLLLLIPFINEIVNKLKKNTYIKLLMVMIIMWCLIPSFHLTTYLGSYLDGFVTCYLLGGYIRRYGLFSRKQISCPILKGVLVYVVGVLFEILGRDIGFRITGMEIFEVFSVVTAVYVFIGFLNLKFQPVSVSCAVERVAKHTFAVYLISDGILRDVIWQGISPNESYIDSKWFFAHFIIKCCVVFLVCVGIDIIREWIFRFVDRISDKSRIKKKAGMVIQRIDEWYRFE